MAVVLPHRQTLAPLCVALAGLTLPSLTLAQPSATYRLDYRVPTGAQGCPGEQSLIDQIARRLGRDPFTASATSAVRVTVVSPQRGHFVVESASAPPTTPRVITGPDCERLIDRMAFSITVVIDPLALTRAQPGPPPPPPSPPPRPPPPPPALVAARAPSPSSDGRTLRVSLGVGAHAAFGAANSAAPGVNLHATLRHAWFSVSLEGRLDTPITTPMEGMLRGEFTSTLAAGALAACAHFRWMRGCGVFVAGALLRESHDIPAPTESVAPYLAAGVRLGVSLPIATSWSVDVHADLLVQSRVVPCVQVPSPVVGSGERCGAAEGMNTPVAVWSPPLVSEVVSAGLVWQIR